MSSMAEYSRTVTVVALLVAVEWVASLSLLELRVPVHVPLGTRATLSCRWQLGPTDVLYSVKWYKDGKEFFRHVPRDTEARRKFSLPGVDVENSDTSGSNLTLAPALLETGGRYRCEVSGERPLFPTVSDHADMTVVVLPDSDPYISGFQPRYQIGDLVHVACTSGRSRPATRLTWYINGEPASTSQVSTAIHQVKEGLETTSLYLTFQVGERHFTNDGFKVKCLATLESVYWRSNEKNALQMRPKVYTEELKTSFYMNTTTSPPVATRDNRLLTNTAFITNSYEMSYKIVILVAIIKRWLIVI